MILTTSNILSGMTPTVTTGISTDLPANITDPDFSLLYRSSDSRDLIFDFGAVNAMSYIAVAGINFVGTGGTTSYVRVQNAGETDPVATVSITRSQVAVLVFPSRSFTNLQIRLTQKSLTVNPLVKFVAGGDYITVPNSGEQSGYNRQHLSRNFRTKTMVNQLSEPITQLRKKTGAKGKLNIPNMTKAFSEGEWMDFIEFAQDNHFFVLENPIVATSPYQGDATSAYLGYDIGKNRVQAHNQTRALNNVSVSFKVYNGL